MSKSITVSYEGSPCYDILLEQDFQKLNHKLKELGYQKEQKVCIVTDSNLETLHLEYLSQKINSCFHKVISFSFPAGEAGLCGLPSGRAAGLFIRPGDAGSGNGPGL